MSPPAKAFVAGELVRHLDAWESLTSDSWVLEVVQGYHLELQQQPFQQAPAVTRPRSQEEQILMEREILELLRKKAIEEVSPSPDQFVSSLFLVPKKDGSYRPVFNLKPLNIFLKNQHFKMEGLPAVKELIQLGIG